MVATYALPPRQARAESDLFLPKPNSKVEKLIAGSGVQNRLGVEKIRRLLRICTIRCSGLVALILHY